VKVLVVEDSNLLRQRLINLLREIAGLEVVGEGQDSQGSLSTLHESKPQVVLIDIHLSKGSGVALIKRIKLEHEALTIIALSDEPSAIYQKRCTAAGADFFLDKTTGLVGIKKIMVSLMKEFETSGYKSDKTLTLDTA